VTKHRVPRDVAKKLPRLAGAKRQLVAALLTRKKSRATNEMWRSWRLVRNSQTNVTTRNAPKRCVLTMSVQTRARGGVTESRVRSRTATAKTVTGDREDEGEGADAGAVARTTANETPEVPQVQALRTQALRTQALRTQALRTQALRIQALRIRALRTTIEVVAVTTEAAAIEMTGAVDTAKVVAPDAADDVVSAEVVAVPPLRAVPLVVNAAAAAAVVRVDAINGGPGPFCPAMKSLKGRSRLSWNCIPKGMASSAVQKKTTRRRNPIRSSPVLWLRSSPCARVC